PAQWSGSSANYPIFQGGGLLADLQVSLAQIDSSKESVEKIGGVEGGVGHVSIAKVDRVRN
ncbi:MAG TPA: hypothetical protein QGI30_01590, partial [Anaerolineales bacterium]|nr:hypothetical protein [Anaerolineales bacterium]